MASPQNVLAHELANAYLASTDEYRKKGLEESVIVAVHAGIVVALCKNLKLDDEEIVEFVRVTIQGCNEMGSERAS